MFKALARRIRRRPGWIEEIITQAVLEDDRDLVLLEAVLDRETDMITIKIKMGGLWTEKRVEVAKQLLDSALSDRLAASAVTELIDTQ